MATCGSTAGTICRPTSSAPDRAWSAPPRFGNGACPKTPSWSTDGNRLLTALACPDYLISTNGDRFHHPDHKAIARILKHGGADPCLRFNCRGDENAIWEDDGLRLAHGYQVEYPAGRDAGLTVTLD